MDDAKNELVQQWLRKALHDLITARALTRREPVVLDTATYHCQQAADKALKAFLISSGHDPERTHDVERLLELAVQFEHGFAALSLRPTPDAARDALSVSQRRHGADSRASRGSAG